ncbi:hypothetical protein HDU96_005895 [Phlyctochytrium bullatum]|nr:hypothetical protein HDU96_005895 [Phlyctochytrium bullatum]
MERTPLLPTQPRRPAAQDERESFAATLPTLQLVVLGFTLLAVPVALWTTPGTLLRDLLLIAALLSFHTAVPAIAILKKSHLWLDLWVYSLSVSVFMPAPDWFLCKVTKSLEFGPTYFIPRFDGLVPVTFCFMWSIPIFIGLAVALSVRDSMESSSPTVRGPRQPSTGVQFLNLALWPAHLAAVVAVGGVICLTEFPAAMVGLWGPTERVAHKWGPAAVYVLPAELLLGMFTMSGFLIVEGDFLGSKLFMGFLVALLYTGSIVLSFGVFEGSA